MRETAVVTVTERLRPNVTSLEISRQLFSQDWNGNFVILKLSHTDGGRRHMHGKSTIKLCRISVSDVCCIEANMVYLNQNNFFLVEGYGVRLNVRNTHLSSATSA
jgi:hypothetical protein